MIELKYTQKFHSGLRFGIHDGATASIIPKEQFETEDCTEWNIGDGATLCLSYDYHDKDYSLDVYEDGNRVEILDGAHMYERSGKKIGKIAGARINYIKGSAIVDGFEIRIDEEVILISVTP